MGPTFEERNLPETLLVYFLEILGAVTAIIFGVFGVLSWSDANIAKQQANTALEQANAANMLALVALCGQGVQGGSSSFSAFCNGVQVAAEASVTSFASSLLGTITPVNTITSAPSTSGSESESGSMPASTWASASASEPATATSVGGSNPTSPSSSASGPGGLSSGTKIGLGVGIGIACVIVFITTMTVWTIRKKPRVPRKMIYDHDTLIRGDMSRYD